MIRRATLLVGILAVLATGAALWSFAGRMQEAGPMPARIVLMPVLSIGVADGDPVRTFGNVTDVVADRAGNLYVLDAAAQRVLVFSRNGAFRGEMGTPGRGPGELLGPVALAMDTADRLYVLDAVNQRLEVFGAGTAGYRRVKSVRLGLPAGDVCAEGDRLYLLSTGEGQPVQEVTFEGEPVRSFGVSPGRGDPLLSVSLAGGHLGCFGGRILHLPMLTPELRAYSLDGTEAWNAGIPEYEAVQVESRGGTVTFTAGRSGAHDMAGAVAELTPEYGLVQVGVLPRGAASPSDLVRIKSYVVSPRDGRVRLLSKDLPRIVGTRDGFAFGVRNDPYPRVELYRITRDDEERR